MFRAIPTRFTDAIAADQNIMLANLELKLCMAKNLPLSDRDTEVFHYDLLCVSVLDLLAACNILPLSEPSLRWLHCENDSVGQ